MILLFATIVASQGWSLDKLKNYTQEGLELFRQTADEDLPVTRNQALHHMDTTPAPGRNQY